MPVKSECMTCIENCKFQNVDCFYQDFGSCTREYVNGDSFAEVREVDLADFKQEAADVCCVLYSVFTLSQQR